jgi:hypothetical protein
MKVIGESFSEWEVKHVGLITTFTEEAVAKMVKNSPGKTIYLDYNAEHRVGEVIDAFVINGIASVICEVEDNYITGHDQFICPAFIVMQDQWEEDSEGKRVIQDTDIVCFGLISNPVEKRLNPIRPYVKKEEEDER